MKITIQLFILISLMLSVTARASNDILIESFHIMPTICVVARDNSCQQNIRFQWKLSNESKSCLYQVGNKTPLYCSDMEQQASVVLMLDVEKENEFIYVYQAPLYMKCDVSLKFVNWGKMCGNRVDIYGVYFNDGFIK